MNSKTQSIGIFILRVGLGASMAIHGYPKMFNPESWEFLGSNMAIIGIQFFPVFWGFLAAVTEFFGGLLLILGAGTRVVSGMLAFTMFIAMLFHITKGDDFKVYSHSLELCLVFIGLIFIGGGRFSLDFYLPKNGK